MKWLTKTIEAIEDLERLDGAYFENTVNKEKYTELRTKAKEELEALEKVAEAAQDYFNHAGEDESEHLARALGELKRVQDER